METTSLSRALTVAPGNVPERIEKPGIEKPRMLLADAMYLGLRKLHGHVRDFSVQVAIVNVVVIWPWSLLLRSWSGCHYDCRCCSACHRICRCVGAIIIIVVVCVFALAVVFRCFGSGGSDDGSISKVLQQERNI